MAFEHLGRGALDYYPCRYGASKLLFRGPQKPLDQPYCAAIGGTETYGKFVEEPYPDLLSLLIEKQVVNLGCMNAGVDVFSLDDTVIEICAGAAFTVVQIMGAQNISNRYYSVHPRRNDRFLKASGLLHAIYRDVDFTDFHFTRHLLTELADISIEKFERVRDELKQTWVTRMKSMLSRMGPRVVLLWLADHAPEMVERGDPVGSDPMFVDREMLNCLSGQVMGLVEVVSTPEEITAGHDRMVFAALEELVACEMLGPVVHESVARKLQLAVENV